MIKSVEKLHKLGYVHRDIKPDNMLLEPKKNERDYDRQVIDAKFEQLEQGMRNSL